LLEYVRGGEKIILAKNGKPCARLVPLEAEKKRGLGFGKARSGEIFFAPPRKKGGSMEITLFLDPHVFLSAILKTGKLSHRSLEL
jgi:antitoxin (DNA-binding transcriptional repressor) of toxin-antitoxin stability system